MEERGWTLEGDEKHATRLVKEYGLDGDNAKSVSSPGNSEDKKLEEFAEELEGGAYAGFRTRAGLAQYIAKNNLVLKFAVKEILRKASCPTTITDQRLKRVARWLVDNRRLLMLYPWQPLQDKVTLKTDSDYAGTDDFRSTTCVLALHGVHYLMGLSVTQPLESLSVT